MPLQAVRRRARLCARVEIRLTLCIAAGLLVTRAALAGATGLEGRLESEGLLKASEVRELDKGAVVTRILETADKSEIRTLTLLRVTSSRVTGSPVRSIENGPSSARNLVASSRLEKILITGLIYMGRCERNRNASLAARGGSRGWDPAHQHQA